MTEIKWYYPFYIAVPFTLLSISQNMAQNVSNLIVGYLFAYVFFYVFYSVFKKKNVEK